LKALKKLCEIPELRQLKKSATVYGASFLAGIFGDGRRMMPLDYQHNQTVILEESHTHPVGLHSTIQNNGTRRFQGKYEQIRKE